MSTLAHSTDAPWSDHVRMPRTSRLKGDVRVDVCVVGGGIAGLTTAYLLIRAGKQVAVLDDGRLAAGQTQVTTAHLSNAIDKRYVNLERIHGRDGARLAAESHTKAIEQIESIVREEDISCEFRRVYGYLFDPPDEKSDLLDQEFDAARRTGIVRVARVGRAPFKEIDTGACLRFEAQAQFHPLKYLAGVARAILQGGGNIFTSTHVKKVQGGGRAHVETSSGNVSADAIVVATNSPINDMFAIHTKQAPYITYAVAARVPRGSLEQALYWDTADPYHYVRIAPVRKKPGEDPADLAIVGGEDHKTGQADDGAERLARLEQWARERIPGFHDPEFHWAGQVMETVDGLAYIGRNPSDEDNVFIITGDCGQGMTHGTLGGMLLKDLILGRDNPWAALYDPKRIKVSRAGTFAKENLNVATQYTSWLTPGEISSPESLGRGQGAIMRRGLTKVAVYRDERGKVTECSAVCPHLDCIVAWNATERTWDCPCHGSRFSPQGEVLNGPANTGLAKLSE